MKSQQKGVKRNRRNATSSAQAVVAPHLVNITVSGYKSIEGERSMDLKPLTVLAGANSAGKSSLIQPLLLLKQTLEDKGDPGPLLILGENVKFTAVDQMLSKCVEASDDKAFIFSFTRSDNTSIKQSYRRAQRGGVELYRSEVQLGSEKFSLDVSMTSDEIEKEVPDWLKAYFLSVSEEGRAKKGSRPSIKWKVKRSGAFLGFFPDSGDQNGATRFPLALGALAPASVLYQNFISSIHVPGVRASPERLYKKASPGPAFPGTFDQYTASIIFQWQEEKDPRLETLFSWLSALSLTNFVRAFSVEDTSFELKVDRRPIGNVVNVVDGVLDVAESDFVSIADVGFGVSQVLPVLVSLLAAAKGALVYVEQPELHLHPRAQEALAEPLRWATEKGVTTVVETHSSILLKALRTMVVRGDIKSEDTILHWFTRDEHGMTDLSSTQFPKDGDLKLPEDFTEIELDATRQFLRAASGNKSAAD